MSSTGFERIDVPLYTPISNSNRSHQYIQLDNGITALLISDPSEPLASFSASIMTGSHNDPDNVPGLAHLCEHMIIASESKNFPKATYYHNLLTEYNGNQNAFTTGEQTCFYFEIPNSNNKTGKPIFDELVKVFADKLKSPLFSASVINQEIQAIDNEHNNNKNLNSKLLYHAIRKLANPKSQFSRFGTGNSLTLAQVPLAGKASSLKNILQKYYTDHFISENINVVVRGSQSIHYLRKLVLSNFGDFRSGTKLHKSIGNSSNRPFQKLFDKWDPIYSEPVFEHKNSSVPNTIFLQSSKSPLLRLVFPVPCKGGSFSRNEINIFAKVWSDLFGDENEGSIHSHLCAKNLLNKHVSQVSKFTVNDKGLVLHFDLTTKGWESGVDSILTHLFRDFIPYILNLDPDIIAIYLNEWNAINMLKFLYQDLDSSTMDKCSDLCVEMAQCEEPSFILNNGMTAPCNHLDSGIDSYYENIPSRNWWIQLAIRFQSFIRTYMNSENCKYILLGELKKSKSFQEAMGHSKQNFSMSVDEYFGLEYVFLRTPTKYSAPTAQELEPINFQLPCSKKFLFGLERNLSALKQSLSAVLQKSQQSSLSMIAKSELLDTQPELYRKNDNYEFWIKREHLLQYSSRSIITVELINMNLSPSAENTMNLEILTQLLFLYINETLYSSERVGYMYQIAANNRGDVRLALTISGFPQGVLKILQVIMDKLVSICQPTFEISKEMFRASRVAVRNKYEEAARANSCTLASLGVIILLEKNLTTLEERLEALEEITLESFKQFSSKLWIPKSNYMNLFIQGDISILDSVNEYMNGVIHHLDSGMTTEKFHLKEPETIRLPKGKDYYIQLSGFKEDPTNSVVYFIETGDRKSPIDYTMTSLLEFFMSLTLVPDLRHKKQIGYVVLGGLRLLTDSLGIHISVMSNLDPETIETKIEEYLYYLEHQVLDKMTEKEFQETILQKYIQLIKSNSLDKLIKTAGPANLMAQIEGSVHSGNYPSTIQSQGYTLGHHKKLKDEISFRTYNFSTSTVDIALLSQLTLASWKHYFNSKISISSEQRPKLSVRFKTSMSQTDVTANIMTMQLDYFLKSKRFHIQKEELQAIVTRTGGKPASFFKESFHHFRAQGQSLKLCTLVLKEICKQIMALTSTSTVASPTSSKQRIPLSLSLAKTEIISVQQFKQIW